MVKVELSDSEWQVVLGMIALAPWREANPLLMKIGDQLRRAQNSGHSAPGPRMVPEAASPPEAEDKTQWDHRK